MSNLWIDMDANVKNEMLRNAVQYGYLSKEFIEECIEESEEMECLEKE